MTRDGDSGSTARGVGDPGAGGGSVGERVRASIPLHLSQRRLAPEIGMTHDALSRALNGQRHFSVLEIARLADYLGLDTHWLITGEQDPYRVRLAARHTWGKSSADQEEQDAAIIARVVETYRAAYAAEGVGSTSMRLPADPSELRAMLPSADVRGLSEQVEGALGIDIVRDPGLSTDYSFRIGEHAVILLKSTIYWFRANWSIAHELGHLALGHHVRDRTTAAEEAPADAFAREFLLPEVKVRAVDWRTVDLGELARWVWDAGVSTAALSHRLRHLNLATSKQVQEALKETTPKLMRAHVEQLRNNRVHGDPIWERENATTGRQFPEHLVAALTERVEVGEADPYLLAWVREVPVDDLSWPEPDVDAPLADQETRRGEEDDSHWFDLLEER
ncbi:XRE family transcriptional regulator [Kribbella sp. NBC_00382]|uniref:helix-turn-helix domain-containing protein n=1 Tax=Kribbella sp. NBC_00382 TaxID=2975967 RepID=UPI002E230D11